ncbi:Uncharacterised protein [Mycobacterium tuberculosis]|nr:Uncharacterised protein [Mycobacterium tuberculosis]
MHLHAQASGNRPRIISVRFGDDFRDVARAVQILVRQSVAVERLNVEAATPRDSRLRMDVHAKFVDDSQFRRVNNSLSRLCGVLEVVEVDISAHPVGPGNSANLCGPLGPAEEVSGPISSSALDLGAGRVWGCP